METTTPNGGNKGSIGTIVGIIVVVVILIVGAVYIFGNKAVETTKDVISEATTTQNVIVDESDLSEIQSDLNGLDVKTLDIDEKNI